MLPWPQTHIRQRIVDCKVRHQRIPCSLSVWWIRCSTPTPSSHIVRGSDVGCSNEWQETSEAWDSTIMALRSTWSYGPIPSLDSAVLSASVINLTACPTQSLPALVDNANWKGEQTDSTVFPNCLAKVFAINLQKLVLVGIPRAPPSFFWNKNCRTSRSSKQTFNISFVHPPGLGAVPDRTNLHQGREVVQVCIQERRV